MGLITWIRILFDMLCGRLFIPVNNKSFYVENERRVLNSTHTNISSKWKWQKQKRTEKKKTKYEILFGVLAMQLTWRTGKWDSWDFFFLGNNEIGLVTQIDGAMKRVNSV